MDAAADAQDGYTASVADANCTALTPSFAKLGK